MNNSIKTFIFLVFSFLPFNQKLNSEPGDIILDESLFEQPELSEYEQKFIETIEFVADLGLDQIVFSELMINKGSFISSMANITQKSAYNALNVLSERLALHGATVATSGKSITPLPKDIKRYIRDSIKTTRGTAKRSSGYNEVIPTIVGEEKYNECLKKYKYAVGEFYSKYLISKNIDQTYSGFSEYKNTNPNGYLTYILSELKILNRHMNMELDVKKFKYDLMAHLVETKQTFKDIIEPHINRKKLCAILVCGASVGLAFNYGAYKLMHEMFPYTEEEKQVNPYLNAVTYLISTKYSDHRKEFLAGQHRNFLPDLINENLSSKAQESSEKIFSAHILNKYNKIIDDNVDKFERVYTCEEEIKKINENLEHGTLEFKEALQKAENELVEAKKQKIEVINQLKAITKPHTSLDKSSPESFRRAIRSLQSNEPLKLSILSKLLPISDDSSGKYLWSNVFNVDDYTIGGIQSLTAIGLSSYSLKRNLKTMLRLIKDTRWESDEGLMWFCAKILFLPIPLALVGMFALSNGANIYDHLENLYIQYKIDEKFKSAKDRIRNIASTLTFKEAQA